VIMDALSITEERKQVIDFTIPYAEAEKFQACHIVRSPSVAVFCGLTPEHDVAKCKRFSDDIML
ncbi:hypothetical protein ACEQ6A_35190, partial [Rhizobium brockwellii]